MVMRIAYYITVQYLDHEDRIQEVRVGWYKLNDYKSKEACLKAVRDHAQRVMTGEDTESLRAIHKYVKMIVGVHLRSMEYGADS